MTDKAFDPNKHPRTGDGTFTEAVHSAPEVGLGQHSDDHLNAALAHWRMPDDVREKVSAAWQEMFAPLAGDTGALPKFRTEEEVAELYAEMGEWSDWDNLTLDEVDDSGHRVLLSGDLPDGLGGHEEGWFDLNDPVAFAEELAEHRAAANMKVLRDRRDRYVSGEFIITDILGRMGLNAEISRSRRQPDTRR